MLGCRVQFVPDYDEKIANDITGTAKKVETYFEKLEEGVYEAKMDTSSSALAYKFFRDDYIAVQVELISLMTRSEQRGELNKESTKQVNNALTLWKKDRESHREKGRKINVNLIETHRKDYKRIFAALSKSEEEKKLVGKSIKIPK